MNTTFILLSYETITGVISKILTRIKIYDNKTFLAVHKCCCPVTEVGIIVISHTSHAICYVGLCSSLCYIVSAYLENLLETGF